MPLDLIPLTHSVFLLNCKMNYYLTILISIYKGIARYFIEDLVVLRAFGSNPTAVGN